MAATLQNAFPQFSLLPAEIQLQIWESTSATLPARQMHIFDVQAPPPPQPPQPQPPSTTLHGPTNAPRRNLSHRRTRSQSPHAKGTLPLIKRIRKSTSPPRRSAAITTSNLSTLPTVSLTSFSTSLFGDARDSSSSDSSDNGFDPSGYKFRDVLRATCVDAANTVRHAEARIPAADRAIIDLPSGRQLVYDNALDVLHLRFLGGGNGNGNGTGTGVSSLSDIFQSMWSPALATALHNARRVAIDVSQIWPELAQQQHKLVQDIVFLVCTLQNNLEVLYLVDYSQQGATAASASAPASAAKTLAGTSKESELYARFHSYGPEREAEKSRPADVIHGNGTVWREVFDFERLGWHERHPGFVFGEMFGEVVRLQQGQWFGEGEKKATFKGVRVLVAASETVIEVGTEYMDES